MIKIRILYPQQAGSRFDMDYYLNTHMPMSIERLGAAEGFRGVSVEEGISGAEPGSAPAYVATCDFLFDSVDAFMAAFMSHAELLQNDIINYTDIEPVIQFNAVKIQQSPSL